MICDGCQHEAGALSVTADGDYCKHCLKRSIPHTAGTIVKLGNKDAPNLTHNEAMHIRTRKIGKDGIVRAHWRYETKDF